MKRSASAFFLCHVFVAVKIRNFLASSFVPIANTERKPSDSRLVAGSFKVNIMAARREGPFRLHSSSSANNLENLSSNEITGPAIPSLEGSTKRLFLVRHGEVINPGGDRPVYYGALDVPLSPLGEAEAKAAAMYLKQFDLDLVVSSPLSRAIYGAEQVLALQKNKEPAVVKMEGFRELDRGAWCGKTKEEIGVETMEKFDACDDSVTPEGGESYSVLKKRVLQDRDSILDRLPAGRAAAIVSHLQVTRSMLSDALDIPTAEMAGLGVATASVTSLRSNVRHRGNSISSR